RRREGDGELHLGFHDAPDPPVLHQWPAPAPGLIGDEERRTVQLSPRLRVPLRRRSQSAAGQTLIEFALVLPLVLLVALGVIETSWALLDDHVVTKISREGSNLISRDTTIQDATTAIRQMASRPVNFDDGSSTVIFSVIKRGAITGTA